jgi:hypothetical protein
VPVSTAINSQKRPAFNRFHSVQGPWGFLSAQKNPKKYLGLVFRPFPGEVVELRFGLEKARNLPLEKPVLKPISDRIVLYRISVILKLYGNDNNSPP